MSAIPSSDMPGHKALHERVYSALDLCKEVPAVDFKRSEPWDTLGIKLIRHLIGMGNLRDGGVIIVGASESDSKWDLSGIDADHLTTYGVDKIIGQVNAYVSPEMDLDVVTVEYRNKKTFLAIQAREFLETPFICKNNGPAGSDSKLFRGTVYIRRTAPTRTEPVTSAEQLRELLDLAAEKRARRMIETSHRLGMVPAPKTKELFDAEVGDFRP